MNGAQEYDVLWQIATARDRRNERATRTTRITDDELLELLGCATNALRLSCGHPAAPIETYRRGEEHWCGPCRMWVLEATEEEPMSDVGVEDVLPDPEQDAHDDQADRADRGEYDDGPVVFGLRSSDIARCPTLDMSASHWRFVDGKAVCAHEYATEKEER